MVEFFLRPSSSSSPPPRTGLFHGRLALPYLLAAMLVLVSVVPKVAASVSGLQVARNEGPVAGEAAPVVAGDHVQRPGLVLSGSPRGEQGITRPAAEVLVGSGTTADPRSAHRVVPNVAAPESTAGEDITFQRGQWVDIVGLLSRPELNGVCAVVVGFVPQSGRYGVRVEPGDHPAIRQRSFGGEQAITMQLKPENLVLSGSSPRGEQGTTPAALVGTSGTTADSAHVHRGEHRPFVDLTNRLALLGDRAEDHTGTERAGERESLSPHHRSARVSRRAQRRAETVGCAAGIEDFFTQDPSFRPSPSQTIFSIAGMGLGGCLPAFGQDELAERENTPTTIEDVFVLLTSSKYAAVQQALLFLATHKVRVATLSDSGDPPKDWKLRDFPTTDAGGQEPTITPGATAAADAEQAWDMRLEGVSRDWSVSKLQRFLHTLSVKQLMQLIKHFSDGKLRRGDPPCVLEVKRRFGLLLNELNPLIADVRRDQLARGGVWGDVEGEILLGGLLGGRIELKERMVAAMVQVVKALGEAGSFPEPPPAP